MRLRRVIRGAFGAASLVAGIAVPMAAQSSGANPAPDGSAPVWVTGVIKLAAVCVGADVDAAEGLVRERGWRCSPQEWVTSDPRLSGRSTNTWNADVWIVDGALVSLRRAIYELANQDGGWRCDAAYHVAHGSGLFFDPDHPESVTCVGTGGYEGLTAIVAVDWSDFQNVTIAGLIVPGEPPPPP